MHREEYSIYFFPPPLITVGAPPPILIRFPPWEERPLELEVDPLEVEPLRLVMSARDMVFGLVEPGGGAGPLLHPHGIPSFGGIHLGNLPGPAGAVDETAQLAGGGRCSSSSHAPFTRYEKCFFEL